MNKRIFFATMLTGIFCISGVLIAGGKGPENIDLKAKYKVEATKPAVVFSHHKHQAKLECTKCHASAEGGKLKFEINNFAGVGNDFHKTVCWPCHKEMNVPKGTVCASCHK
jgi:hypothetical protein